MRSLWLIAGVLVGTVIAGPLLIFVFRTKSEVTQDAVLFCCVVCGLIAGLFPDKRKRPRWDLLVMLSVLSMPLAGYILWWWHNATGGRWGG